MKALNARACWRRVGLLAALLLLVGQVPGSDVARAAAAAAGQAIEFSIDPQGVTRLVHNKTALIDAADPGCEVLVVRVQQADGSIAEHKSPKPTSMTFDAATQTRTLAFDWGSCAVTMRPTSYGVEVVTVLSNTSPQTISGIELAPVHLRIVRAHLTNNANISPVGFRTEHATGVLGLMNGAPEYRLFLRHDSATKAGAVPVIFASIPPRVSKHPVINNDLLSHPGSPVLAPGGKMELRLQIGLAQSGTSLLSGIFPEYRQWMQQRWPVSLNWPDRRSIGMIFLCNPATKWKTNPRGFLFGGGEKNDVFSPEGLEKFGQALMAYADANIQHLKSMNAQGVIVWDIEGQEYPHAITYLGDPRVLPEAAPEMDKFADAFMAKFRDAGFKVGLTIRPTEVYNMVPPDQPGRFLFHRESPDPVQLMSDKITYAKKRWGATIFYLDSNLFTTIWGSKYDASANVPGLMPVSMIRKLHELHPDCLIIPEWANEEYYRFASPYASPNLGEGVTYPAIQDAMPGVFRCVATTPTLISERFEDFVRGVSGGDVLMFQSWFRSGEQAWISLVYRESELRKLAASSSPGATPSLQGDETARFLLAHALAERTDPESLRQTATLLRDKSAHVQLRALRAIGMQRQVADAKVIEQLLRFFAREPAVVEQAVLMLPAAYALGALGESAVPSLLEVIGEPPVPDLVDNPEDPKSPTRLHAFRALARTMTKNPEVAHIIVNTLKTQDANWRRLRGPAAEAAGLLQIRDAVPALIALLNDRATEERTRIEVILALGELRDQRSIKPLIAQVGRNWTTPGLGFWGPMALNLTLTKVTGVQGVLGAEWRKWETDNPQAVQASDKR